jgi:hypothetical protein
MITLGDAVMNLKAPVRVSRMGRLQLLVGSYLKGLRMADERRAWKVPSCPRCDGELKDVVTIPGAFGGPGLIAYECRDCGYLTSEIVGGPQSTGYHFKS